MNKARSISAFAVSLVVSFAVQAADTTTTELKVKGAISPAACAPTFAEGSVANYGIIPASSLKAGQYTNIGTKQIPFAIACVAATKMAVKAVDNRARSVVPQVARSIRLPYGGRNGWGQHLFGLGNVAGKNVGAFAAVFRQHSYMGDSQYVDTISSTNGGQSWWTPSAGALQNGQMNSWARIGTTTPGAYKQLRGIILINAVINKPENLILTQDVPLDGSVTLEMIYM